MQISAIKNNIINTYTRQNVQTQGMTSPVTKSELPSFADAKSFVNIHFKGVEELTEAACDGDLETLRKEIANGTDVNEFDYSGSTALIFAAQNNQLEIIEELLKCPGIDVNLQNDDGCTALYKAVDEQNQECFEKLLQHPDIDVNKSDEDGDNPLTSAAYYGSAGMVEKLVKHPKIDINIKDCKGDTALICAVMENHPKVAELLLQHPDINVNAKRGSGNGYTALMIAAETGDIDCAEKILQHPDVSINAKNKYGHTAKDLAKDNNNDDIVKMIKEYPKGVDRRPDILNIANGPAKKPPVDINHLSPEENIWGEKEISSRFLRLVSEKKFDQATGMLTDTPFINLEADDSKILRAVCTTGEPDFVRRVFNYQDKQPEMLEDYNKRRQDFLDKTIKTLSYEDLKENPVALNTTDGFQILMDKEEFNPNDTVNKTTLFEYACGIDSEGQTVKQILSKYDDIDTSGTKRGTSKEIKALVNEYETKGKYQLKFEKIKRNMFNPETRDIAIAQFKEYINSNEFKPDMTDTLGNSALHLAAIMPDDSAKGIIQKLVDKGVSLDSENITKQNALVSAIKAMRIAHNDEDKIKLLSNIKFLLDKGLDVNAPDSNGQTAFHHACSTTSVALLTIILAKEPNIFMKDNLGHKGSFYLSTPQMKEAYSNYVI